MIVWWNGTLCSLESVRISPLDRGFLYGDGLFETIRLQKGKPLYLPEHLERLRKSLEYFRFVNVEKFFEEDRVNEIISDLYRANPGIGDVARLKIIVTRGENPSIGLPEVSINVAHVTILFIVTSYQPPSDEMYRKGWSIELLPGCYSPPLGSYKTLNYLFYLWAKEHAHQNGFQDAVFEDSQNRIVEASTASIALFIDGRWVFPSSPWKLNGVTERIVGRILEEEGEIVTSQEITKSDLFKAQSVWLMNSLIGVMPVSRVNDCIVPETKSEYAFHLRNKLFYSDQTAISS